MALPTLPDLPAPPFDREAAARAVLPLLTPPLEGYAVCDPHVCKAHLCVEFGGRETRLADLATGCGRLTRISKGTNRRVRRSVFGTPRSAHYMREMRRRYWRRVKAEAGTCS